MDEGAQSSAQQSYTALFNSLQQTVNAKYFAGLYDTSVEAGQHTISGTSENPLKKYLTTPKLSEEHLQYLGPQR